MDDLKVYGKNDEELQGLPNMVKIFNNDIGMEFSLDKCAKATFIRGGLTSTSETKLDAKEIDQEETYKYLGIDEGDSIQHAKMKEKKKKSVIDE